VMARVHTQKRVAELTHLAASTISHRLNHRIRQESSTARAIKVRRSEAGTTRSRTGGTGEANELPEAGGKSLIEEKSCK
jgi:alpha-D-ribose 1-methylphosphonate 5-triphosphate synthase subunit PhnG